MNHSMLHVTPTWRNVIRAEVDSVGLAARPALVVAGALALVTTVPMILGAVGGGTPVDVSPELAYALALIAPLLPVAVWKAEYRYRRSYIASLPVDPPRHALAKVAVGWVWLVFMAAAFLLWMFTLAMFTGGEIGVDETRIMAGYVPADALPEDLSALARRWRTPAWQWAVVITGPTVTYLVGSALVLATNRTRLWLGGIVMAGLLLAAGAEHEYVDLGRAVDWFEAVAEPVASGRFGLLSLFSPTDAYVLTTPAGDEIAAWGRLPTMMDWLVATALWFGLALTSLMAVVYYDRD